MHLVHPSERIVSVNDVYGGVYRLFSQVYEPKGYALDVPLAEEINAGSPTTSTRGRGSSGSSPRRTRC